MLKKILGISIVFLVITSCASRKKMQYYQDISSVVNAEAVTYSPVLKQDDLLLIIVSAPNPEAAKDFNLGTFEITPDGTKFNVPDQVSAQRRYQSYLIDNNGFIEFPVLGQLKLGGMTRADALTFIKEKLKPYINEPIVNLRILNFKVTVQGEVANPGIFSINTERITLPEALSMAGDLTINGKRENVLIIREIDGKKSYHFVDLTKADFINSPFYYLSQNDVIYVEPNQTKINSSVVGANISIILTSVSLLITIIALLIR